MGQVPTKKTKIETNKLCPFEKLTFLRLSLLNTKATSLLFLSLFCALIYAKNRFSKGHSSLVSILVFLVNTWPLLVVCVEKLLSKFYSFNLHVQIGVNNLPKWDLRKTESKSKTLTFPKSEMPKCSGLTSHKCTGSSKTFSNSSRRSRMAKVTDTLWAHWLKDNLAK